MAEINRQSDITQDRLGSLLSQATNETGIPEGAKIEIKELHHHVTINQTGDLDTTGYSLNKDFSFSVFVKEAQIVNELKEILSEMLNALEDESYLGQLKVAFFNVLSKIEDRKKRRELYFSDLCIMLTESMKNSSTGTLTKRSLELLTNAIDCLSKKIDQELIIKLRQEFREADLDILPKFTAIEPISIEEKIKALFS